MLRDFAFELKSKQESLSKLGVLCGKKHNKKRNGKDIFDRIKIGGTPHLPSGIDWPTYKNKQMIFLAELSLQRDWLLPNKLHGYHISIFVGDYNEGDEDYFNPAQVSKPCKLYLFYDSVIPDHSNADGRLLECEFVREKPDNRAADIKKYPIQFFGSSNNIGDEDLPNLSVWQKLVRFDAHLVFPETRDLIFSIWANFGENNEQCDSIITFELL